MAWRRVAKFSECSSTQARPRVERAPLPALCWASRRATSWPAIDQGGIALLDAYLDAHPDTKLIVIDTLHKMRPAERRGASSYGQDYGRMAPLQDLCTRRDVGIVPVTNLRKMRGDDPLDLVSGTMGLTGAADNILVLMRSRGSADATLHVTGRPICWFG